MKARLPHAARHDEPNPPERYRSRGIALLLAIVPFFFSILGLHRFYLGYTGHGVAYLLGIMVAIFLLYLGAVGIAFGSNGFTAIVLLGFLMATVLYGLQISDVVQIINGSLKPKNGEYNPGFFKTKPRTEVPVPEQR
ncbi:TM2 domain-containing protein [Hymenobacter glacialis]|uniref:TM2 domain-containing protein n=1 Tax=Hymenobacter glacialis TaxID=1908236 RepID=A0A1G1T752_9BACT|nr:TM2 domain-containing protein [Hymenobacter glacialis]OGX86700.1 hypothetical protein BEN48_12235 [Hymenobacter glacialis]